jgi:multidrug efflux pump subunit AcrB
MHSQADSARQIEDLVMSTRPNQPIRVRDVAYVETLYQDRGRSIGFEGREAVAVTIFRRLGGNTINISNNLRDLLDRQPPERIRATIVYDQARFVETAIDNVHDAPPSGAPPSDPFQVHPPILVMKIRKVGGADDSGNVDILIAER